jgi:hypothetical protein
MILENWTPHPLALHDNSGNIVRINPTGPAPRLAVQRENLGELEGLPIVRSTMGTPEGLPEPRDGVVLIVSALVAEAAEGRNDLAYPGEAIRDPHGLIVGARGLCAGPGLARRIMHG